MTSLPKEEYFPRAEIHAEIEQDRLDNPAGMMLGLLVNCGKNHLPTRDSAHPSDTEFAFDTRASRNSGSYTTMLNKIIADAGYSQLNLEPSLRIFWLEDEKGRADRRNTHAVMYQRTNDGVEEYADLRIGDTGHLSLRLGGEGGRYITLDAILNDKKNKHAEEHRFLIKVITPSLAFAYQAEAIDTKH